MCHWRTKTAMAILTVLAVTAVVIVFRHARETSQAPQASPRQEPSSTGVDDAPAPRQAADELTPEDIETAHALLAESVRERTSDAAGLLPPTKAEAQRALMNDPEAQWAAIEKVEDLFLAAFDALENYREVREQLVGEIAEEYGPVTAGRVPALVDEAAGMEERFWLEGDFTKLASFDYIYRARALLELCVEADPYSEDALRGLSQVIQSGWPSLRTTYGPQVYVENIRRAKDVYVVLHQLWQNCLSKREAKDFWDIAYAYDFMIATQLVQWCERDLETLYELNETPLENRIHYDGDAPRASDDLASISERIEAAQWVSRLAARKGGYWKTYEDTFDSLASDLLDFGELPSVRFITDTTWYDSLEEKYRRSWWRGTSFVGHPDRASSLMPMHIAGELSEQMFEAMRKGDRKKVQEIRQKLGP